MIPRPEQLEYIRMIANKKDNKTLDTPRFKAWLQYVKRERIRTTNKINEL